MAQLLFQDALLNCPARKMKNYYLKNNIPFKILLIVCNVPRHSLLLMIFIPILNGVSASKNYLFSPMNRSRS